MAKVSARALAVIAVVLLGGCAHRAKTAPTAESQEPFRLGREDIIDVSVWRDGDLSRTLPVRPDGYISMPLAGEVQAEGKTPVELAEMIKGKLAPYVQDPKVTVIVREVNSSRVYVSGEVARPGAYPLRGRVSVVQAIALAGGFTAFADRDSIVLIRSNANGERYSVRYSDLVAQEKEEGKESDFVLRPGDTLVVP
jgi:polysaccharide export outer membrane protein